MPTGHVYIATSLDGFLARSDDTLDWLMKQEAPGGAEAFQAFMDSVDGMVMGAGTFRTVIGFGQWPYTVPVVVASRSLTADDLPAELADRVRISPLSALELMAELGADGWERVYVDGGRLVQAFLREGLIADMRLTLAPILIGAGKPLFGELAADIDLELVSAETAGGLLHTHYRVKQPHIV